jgi:hypothetical protein
MIFLKDIIGNLKNSFLKQELFIFNLYDLLIWRQIMELEIVKVELEDDEHILLRAIRACDLTSYVIKDSTYKNVGGKRIISNKRTNTFWFSDHYPEYIVNAGDYIFLFTGHGKYAWFDNRVGTITHKFFPTVEKSLLIMQHGSIFVEVGEL